MSQPQIRGTQLDQVTLNDSVSVSLEYILGAPVTVSNPLVGESLTYSGSPAVWSNSGAGGTGVSAGDGLSSAGGSPTGTQVLSVDSTVARLDAAVNDFSFAGTVSLNLTDTSQAADEDTWRISNVGGQLTIATRTDADAAGNNAIVIDRTGTTVDSVTSTAPVLITASGTGTSSGLQLNSNIPTIVFNDSDATASEGIWDIVSASATSSLDFRTRTDAHGSGATWLTVVRTGTAITSIDFVGASMTFNGVEVAVGSPVGSGGGGGITGTVANDQVVIGTGASTVDSASTLTFNGSNLLVDTTGTGVTGIEADSAHADAISYLGVWNNESQQYWQVGAYGSDYEVGNRNLGMYMSTDVGPFEFVGDYKIFMEFDQSSLSNSFVDIMNGTTLRIHHDSNPGGSPILYGSPKNTYVGFQHDGTDLNVTGANTTAINVDTILNVTNDIHLNSQKAISEEGFYLTLNHGSPQPFANGVYIPGETLFGGNMFVDTNGAGPGIQIGDGDMDDGDVLLRFNSDAPFDFYQDGNTSTANLALRANINDDFKIQNSTNTDQFVFDISAGDFTATGDIFVGGSPLLLGTQTTSTDGVLSSVKIQDAEGIDVDVGFNQMLWKVKNATMGTTDDDWRAHAGHVTISDDGSAYTWTTPASTDNVVPAGATYTFANIGAGNITIAAGSGVTITWLDGDTGGTGSRTLAQYGVASLSKRSATVWYVWGTGLT